MGCGTSRDDSNYHGVTQARRANNNSSVNSSTSASDSDQSPELDVDSVGPGVARVEKRKRKKAKKAKTKEKVRNDALFNFGDFKVKMVDELTRDESLRSTTNAVCTPGIRKVALKSFSDVKLRSYHMYALGGHPGRIRLSLLYNNDRRVLSCGSDDALIIMREDQTEQGRLVGHDDAIVGGCVSEDFRFVVTTSRDCTAILWDVQAQRIMHSFVHPKVVTCASFNLEATMFVTGCQDQLCRVWEVRTFRELFNFREHKGIVLCIKFAPSGFIASGASDRRVMLWKMPESKPQQTLVGHTGAVFSVDISGSSDLVLSCDETSAILWNSADGSKAYVFLAKVLVPKHHWTALCFCPYAFGPMVVIASSNCCVFIFGAKGDEIVSLDLRSPASVVSRGTTGLVIGDYFGNNYLLKLM